MIKYKQHNHKIRNRVISALLVFAITLQISPIQDLTIGNLQNTDVVRPITAMAIDSTDEDDPDFPHKSDGSISIQITELVAFSENCVRYHTYHQNDKIKILGTTGDTTYFAAGFKGFGTDARPFAGSVEIENNANVTLNLDAPLFNAVYDTVQLNNGNPIKISRYYDSNRTDISNSTPFLAQTVYDGSSDNAGTWNVVITKPTQDDDPNVDPVLAQFGGLIGTMDSGSKLNLGVDMSQVTGEKTDTNPIEINGTGNTGFACGTIMTGAELELTLTGDRKIASVSTPASDVGGLVGKIESAGTFTYHGSNPQLSDGLISTDQGYAGGIVGENLGGTVVLDEGRPYDIQQHITGTQGAGGVYGRYVVSAAPITPDLYNINCQVNGDGSTGGLYGIVESTCAVSIPAGSNKIISSHSSGAADCYGGLIGTYIACNTDENTSDSKAHALSIGAVTVQTDNASGASASFYGGAVGKVDDTNPSYVSIDGFSVDTASGTGSLTFGGTIASADNAFVDVKDFTLKSDSYKGGGVVGSLDHGILRLSGYTKLTDARAENPAGGEETQVGQLVGYRDDALIFATNDWKFHRYENDVTVDDIGAWGEVLRLNSILSVNETDHTVVVTAPTSYVSIGSKDDFARASLCFSINADHNAFLSFADTSYTWETIKNADISFTADIDLSGTGITGLTRDNEVGTEEKHVYCGTLSGGSVALAVGEYYGYRNNAVIDYDPDRNGKITRAHGDGTIYRHAYNGLVGVSNVTGENKLAASGIKIKGSVDVCASAAMYVGGYAGRVTGTLKADGATVSTAFTHRGGKPLLLGGITGETAEAVNVIEIANSSFSGSVTGDNSDGNSCFAGIIGKISHASNAATAWNMDTVALSGTVENTAARTNQRIGGLIACINGYSSSDNVYNSRKLVLNGVTADDLKVNGKVSSMDGDNKLDSKTGGLLGFSWYNTDVEFQSVTIGETTGCTVSMDNLDGYGNFAGLVYAGTGNWKVTDLDVSNITVNSAAEAVSFGMILNTGWNNLTGSGNPSGNASVVYLLLPTTGCYTITSAVFGNDFDTSVYDELIAYSSYYRTGSNGSDGNLRYGYVDGNENDLYVLRNHQGVVSIHTNVVSGLTMDGSQASNSYALQTSKGNTANPYTRYYYNLDSVTSSDSTKLTTPQMKMMSWGLHQYAHRSIASNFASVAFDNLEYDMTGYSWYPVDMDSGSITVKGTFTFANEEFEGSEQAKYNANTSKEYDRTSLDTSAKTQHYLLHAGIFRNVTGTVNVGAANTETVTFKGNISNANEGSGVLICGTVRGSNANSHANVNTKGKISLSGIRIGGFRTETEENGQTVIRYAEYAPLLINKIDSNSDISISDVFTAKDTNNTFFYPNGIKAASSLIGNAGNATTDSIKIEFSRIKLDARDAATLDLNAIYNTTSSIFTKATLLNQFSYRSGGTGIYNYEHSRDWDGTTHIGNVTYGLEIWDGSTNNETSGRSQYFTLEHKYLSSEYFTSPEDSAATGEYSFAGYLPYVNVAYNKTNKTYQLEVNHSSLGLEGCGTYNDPYTFSNQDPVEAGKQLSTIESILNNRLSSQKINIPMKKDGTLSVADLAATWCNSTAKHSAFTYKGENTDNETTYPAGFYLDNTYAVNTSGKKDKYLTVEEVRTYLAGAYYQLGSAITINDTSCPNFLGLGNTSNDFAVFRGVFDCAGYTITNSTQYPLIASSYGSAVKNGNIIVKDATITKTGNTKAFATDESGNVAYGAVIGKILGGDNIIDGVTVSFTGSNIHLNGDYAQLVPVGGYVGIVLNGGLIFRGMDEISQNDKAGLPTGIVSVTIPNGDPVNNNNKRWLYVNPIIGRVINGYAVTESDAYRPYEDGTRTYKGGTTDEVRYWDDSQSTEVKTAPTGLRGVTMRNGNKNYSITDIKSVWGMGSDGKWSLTYNDTENGTTATKYYLTDEEKLGFDSVSSTNASKDKTKPLIPNGQSFFLMSVMVNSGASSSDLGYYNTNQISRSGQYDEIGTEETDPSKCDDYNLYAKNDVLNDSKNNSTGLFTKSKNPCYLAKYYTLDAASAKVMANTDTILTLTTNNGEYYLPDGYKGIGNLYNSGNDKYRMRIKKFNGQGATISLNSSYYYYYAKLNNNPISPTNQEVNDYKNQAFDTAYPNITEAGFGLINYQNGTASKTNGGFSNFTLTGNVISDCIDSKSSNGGPIPYLATITEAVDTSSGKGYDYGIDRTQMISAGMLIGTSKQEQYLDSVAVNNIYVKGVRVAGGLIGHIPGSNTTYTNTLAIASEKIKVHSGGTVGGMIGKSYNGDISINNNNATYSITEVVSDCDYRYGHDYNYGIGGFVGYARRNSGKNAKIVSIQNVIVGDKNASTASIIKCNDDCIAGLITGGFSGMQNRIALDVDNCKVYNQSVTSPYHVGGLLGYIATIAKDWNGDKIEIMNVEIYANNKSGAKIESTGIHSNSDGSKIAATGKFINHVGAGGFIGALKQDCKVSFIIQDCSIEGYNISGAEVAGGVVGVLGHHPYSSNQDWQDNTLVLDNFKISGCSIKATSESDFSYAGGLVGVQFQNQASKQRYVYGYNILESNIDIIGTHKGGISGLRSNDQYCLIKIAGFSRQDDRDGNKNTMISSLVGEIPETNPFGAGGYVIFADYDDAASSEPVKSFSNIATGNNDVSTMRSKITTKTTKIVDGKEVTDTVITYGNYADSPSETTTEKDGVTTVVTVENENYPFVTSSPKWVIGGTKGGSNEQFLTGDGVQGLVFDASRFKEIQDDIAKTGDAAVAKAYRIAPAIPATVQNDGETAANTAWTDIADNYSTSAAVYSHIPNQNKIGMPNFPMLVVSNTNATELTTTINNYLQTLTNTNYNYADPNNSAIYTTALYKCTWDMGNKTFSADTSTNTTANLQTEMTSGTSGNIYRFKMTADNVDTNNETPIFSLIDVQFKDPSGSGKIAYHLYVPVYVKKLLRYDFRLDPESGTDYLSHGIYGADRKTLFENIGNPVTVGFEYEYKRNASEWLAEINAGENILTNYYKSLTLNNHTGTWPAGTKMILVDAANGGKQYYLNTPPGGTAINLYDFTDNGEASGTHYKPAPFNNLMSVNIEPSSDPSSNLVLCVGSNAQPITDMTAAIAAGATVRDKDGKYYRLYDSSNDNEDVTKYAATEITFKGNSTSAAVERYYLTILTPTNENDTTIYHYEISSRGSFDRELKQNNNIIWQVAHWSPNSIQRTQQAHLLLGNLYNNNLTLNVVPRKADTQLMGTNNNWLTVTMTANIGLTQSAIAAGVNTNMGDNPDSTIFQTFLMSYDKIEKRVADGGQSEFGVSIAADASIGSDMEYYIQGGIVAANSDTWRTSRSLIEPDSPDPQMMYASRPEITENYIEFANNQNLINYLADADNQYNHSVSMQVKFDAVYQPKLLIYQFPKNDYEDNTIGASVIGYSNVSSSSESAKYSATSKSVTDSYRYYTTDDSAAVLEYNVVQTNDHITGPYSYLGKNAIELEDASTKSALSYVDTNARYDTRALRTDNDYIEFTLTLTNRKNGYAQVTTGNPDSTAKGLKLSDYLTDLTIYGANNSAAKDNPLFIFNKSANNESTAAMGDATELYDKDGTTLLAKVTQTDSCLTLRIHKSLLNGQGEGIYLLPIDFNVKTGDHDFKSDGLAYSNYMVSITAATYKDMTTTDFFTPSYASDHIIYTNTRLDPTVQ